MAICAQSISVSCLLAVQTVLIICVSTPTAGTHQFPQHYTMIHWAGRIEKELEKVLQHVTGAQQMRSIYNEKKSQFEIKRNNPKDLVERVARDISKLLNSKSKALEFGTAIFILPHFFILHLPRSSSCVQQRVEGEWPKIDVRPAHNESGSCLNRRD